MPTRQEFPGPHQPGRKAGAAPPREAPLLSLGEVLILAMFLACVGATILSLEFWAARPGRFRIAPHAVGHPFLTPAPPAMRGAGALDAASDSLALTSNSP